MCNDALTSRGGVARSGTRVPYSDIFYICFTNLFTEVLWEVRLFCSR